MYSSRMLFSMMFLTGAVFAASTTTHGEPNDPRKAARILAKIESAMQKKDLKAYCAATYGALEYVGYSERACQFEVKQKHKKPQDCAPEKINAAVAKERSGCLAMSSAEFDKAIRKQTGVIEDWKKRVAANGGNPDKLLADARAELAKVQSPRK